MSLDPAPTTESGKIIRDHLTPAEVYRLIDAEKKKGGWYAYRNATLILLLYRHGLRRSEAAHLRWSDVDLYQFSKVLTDIEIVKSKTSQLNSQQLFQIKNLRAYQFFLLNVQEIETVPKLENF
jgi:type 1 fimbriae regulatory protein FimB/type 1 fimbriae regulatory protein FimE